MTILERLLGHDAWTTRQLLLRCKELSNDQMCRIFDIGDRNLWDTFDHLIYNMESHTDYLLGKPADLSRNDKSIDGMLARLTMTAKEFAAFVIRVERDGRADDLATNPENDNQRSLGGVIAHVITHSMHHRAQILYMMDNLGLKDVIEGDVLGWESVVRGWGWADGGSYGSPSPE